MVVSLGNFFLDNVVTVIATKIMPGESVLKTDVTRQSGYLYYLAGSPLKLMKKKAGRSAGGAASVVMSTGLQRAKGYLYFAAGSTGSKIDIRRSKMARRGRGGGRAGGG